MKLSILGLCFLLISVQWSYAQTTKADPTPAEQELLNLSKQKWVWMADKKTDELSTLFHDKSMFVHMGGSWGKVQEIDVIKSGNIWYKKAEVYSASVNIIGNTAILLNDIDLVAVVGNNEVINPFMVTEVYVKENGKWVMGSLTFSRLMRPVKLKQITNSRNNLNQSKNIKMKKNLLGLLLVILSLTMVACTKFYH